MCKSSDRKPPRVISGRDISRDKKSHDTRDTKGAPISSKRADTRRKSLLFTSVLLLPARAANNSFFWSGGTEISHNMRADARGNTLDVASVLLQNSGYEASDEGIAGEYAIDPSHFERWCRL